MSWNGVELELKLMVSNREATTKLGLLEGSNQGHQFTFPEMRVRSLARPPAASSTKRSPLLPAIIRAGLEIRPILNKMPSNLLSYMRVFGLTFERR